MSSVRRKSENLSTREKALREAKDLLQRGGFNGFSFQHVADRLGINKVSLFSHFESKEALGEELVAEYQRQVASWIGLIEDFTPDKKLGALFDLYLRFARDDFKICPLLALTADMGSLPKGVRTSAAEMAEFLVDWIQSVIEEGQRTKVFRTRIPARKLARSIMAMGLGAQMTARLLKDTDVIQETRAQALELLEFTSA